MSGRLCWAELGVGVCRATTDQDSRGPTFPQVSEWGWGGGERGWGHYIPLPPYANIGTSKGWGQGIYLPLQRTAAPTNLPFQAFGSELYLFYFSHHSTSTHFFCQHLPGPTPGAKGTKTSEDTALWA